MLPVQKNIFCSQEGIEDPRGCICHKQSRKKNLETVEIWAGRLSHCTNSDKVTVPKKAMTCMDSLIGVRMKIYGVFYKEAYF